MPMFLPHFKPALLMDLCAGGLACLCCRCGNGNLPARSFDWLYAAPKADAGKALADEAAALFKQGHYLQAAELFERSFALAPRQVGPLAQRRAGV
jgi:hypothetical protein